MQKFLKFFSSEKIKINLKNSFQKFPIPFISAILLFGISEFLVLRGNYLSEYLVSILSKVNLALIIVYFLGIGVNLFLQDKIGVCGIKEGRSCMIKKKIIGFMPIIFGLLFFFNFEENLFHDFYFEEILYVFISLIGVISFLFISKFIHFTTSPLGRGLGGGENIDNENYFLFLTEKISKIGLSIFLGIALMLLGFIAFWAVFELFEISNFLNEGKIFGSWAVFALSFFAPVYFLGIIGGKEKTENFEKISDNKFFNFFIKFLALPAIILYFVILYSYTIKVLLNFQNWPEGMISWLIIFFSLFGYLVYILSFVIEKKSIFVRIFRKYFPFAVLFQTPVFFYAIYLRINQYDFTINRYLLLVFGIYLLVISLYFIFSQKKKLMNIFGILFMFIALISVSGSFSVYKFPENRQSDSLKQNLLEVGILKEVDGKFSGKNKGEFEVFLPEKFEDVDPKISGKIYEIIDYLCINHGCNVLGKFLPKVLEEIKKEDFEEWGKTAGKERKEEYKGISSRTYENSIIEKLKVRRYSVSDNNIEKFITFRLKNYGKSDFFEIKDYDYLVKIRDSRDYFLEEKNKKIQTKIYSGKFDSKNELITIYKNGEKLEEFNIGNDFENFYKENIFAKNQRGSVELEKKFILEKKGKKIDIKIILSEFSLKNPDYEKIEDDKNSDDINISADFYNYTDGVILIKEK